MLEFLGGGGLGNGPATRIDTHCASIFLTPDRAWKLKRAVRFGYLDYSTAPLRRAALETELALNRRTAPDLYITVHPVTCDAAGGFAIDGTGATVDWLLEMHRFPDGALLADLADRGALNTPLLVRLADRIQSFHAECAVERAGGGADAIRSIIAGNIASMAAFPGILDPGERDRLEQLQGQLVSAHAPLLDARVREGRVRHGHGDLHLQNIALIDGEPTLFDCLEFSVELATVDLLYDLAFLLMDLWQRGLKAEANMVFNRYLDLSPEDEGALALMPLFMSIRASIRAHVLAAQSERAGSEGEAAAMAARERLWLALALLEPAPPMLVAIGGLSGTGKSTLARALGALAGRPPGARILRSDVLRKRLAGVPPEERLPPESYTAEASAAVYAEIDRLAAGAMAQGSAAIVDAVSLRRSERDALQAIADAAGAPFLGIWLEADDEDRVARIAGREADASDATVAVAQAQARQNAGPLPPWHVIRASRPLTDMIAAVTALPEWRESDGDNRA